MPTNISSKKEVLTALAFLISVIATVFLFSQEAFGYMRVAELHINPEDVDYFDWEVYPSENFRHRIIEPSVDNYFVSNSDSDNVEYIYQADGDGHIIATKNNKYGILDSNRNILVDFKYEAIDGYGEGLFGFKDNSGKWGFIDISGTIILSAIYDGVSVFSDGLAVAKIGDNYFYLDKSGNRYFEGKIHPTDWRATNESYFYDGVAYARIYYPQAPDGSQKRTFGLIRNPLYNVSDIKRYNGEIRIIVNEEELESDVSPVIIDDRTYAPLRVICEALGFEVDYSDAESRLVKLSGDEKTVVLNLDNNTIIINNIESQMDQPMKIIENRVMVPVRFISETLGFYVSWFQYTKTIMIYR